MTHYAGIRGVANAQTSSGASPAETTAIGPVYSMWGDADENLFLGAASTIWKISSATGLIYSIRADFSVLPLGISGNFLNGDIYYSNYAPVQIHRLRPISGGGEGAYSQFAVVSPTFRRANGAADIGLANVCYDWRTELLYVNHKTNNALYKIFSLTSMEVLAGQPPTAGYSGDDGLARNSMLSGPDGLYCAYSGDFAVADSVNKALRIISNNVTAEPTFQPTFVPTFAPTFIPTVTPTVAPSESPTVVPTFVPTVAPTVSPTVVPTINPTAVPTTAPTAAPTMGPTVRELELLEFVTRTTLTGVNGSLSSHAIAALENIVKSLLSNPSTIEIILSGSGSRKLVEVSEVKSNWNYFLSMFRAPKLRRVLLEDIVVDVKISTQIPKDTDADTVYNTLVGELSAASGSGQFTQALQSSGVTEFADSSLSSMEIGEAVVYAAPTEEPTAEPTTAAPTFAPTYSPLECFKAARGRCYSSLDANGIYVYDNCFDQDDRGVKQRAVSIAYSKSLGSKIKEGNFIGNATFETLDGDFCLPINGNRTSKIVLHCSNSAEDYGETREVSKCHYLTDLYSKDFCCEEPTPMPTPIPTFDGHCVERSDWSFLDGKCFESVGYEGIYKYDTCFNDNNSGSQQQSGIIRKFQTDIGTITNYLGDCIFEIADGNTCPSLPVNYNKRKGRVSLLCGTANSVTHEISKCVYHTQLVGPDFC